MLRRATLPALLLLAACGGQSDEEALRNAAEQSDPAAAAVLNEAANAGVDPQQALEAAGEAQVQHNVETSSTLQAKPNLPEDPNRPEGGQPPEKIDVQQQNEAAAEEDHANHQ